MTTRAEMLSTSADERTDRRLRTAGIVAIAAAALGSVLLAPAAASEVPSTDNPCRIRIVGDQWYGSGCAPVAR